MLTKNDLNSSNIETCFVTKIKFWTVTLTTITYAKQKNKQKIKKTNKTKTKSKKKQYLHGLIGTLLLSL